MNPIDPLAEPAALVGISACVRDVNGFPFHAVNQRYLVALSEAARVVPMIVPALGDRLDMDATAARFDGLLVTGSPSNVEPYHYGAEPAAPDILHDPARDATTLPLLRAALRQGIPVLAICRGIQELNVAMGGSLHQFLHTVEGKRDHRSDKSKPPGERSGPAHTVTLTPGGTLHRLADAPEVVVNSLHAQAIDRLADGLTVEALSPDGVIEAVCVAEAPTFAVGVQWHPEALWQSDRLSRRLFETFGDACRMRAAERRHPAAARRHDAA
ncbi:MAG: gamma-glutamyl-gamma-aminobutyrate hydrolase family protein [Alphaproteobacteria bacterium]